MMASSPTASPIARLKCAAVIFALGCAASAALARRALWRSTSFGAPRRDLAVCRGRSAPRRARASTVRRQRRDREIARERAHRIAHEGGILADMRDAAARRRLLRAADTTAHRTSSTMIRSASPISGPESNPACIGWLGGQRERARCCGTRPEWRRAPRAARAPRPRASSRAGSCRDDQRPLGLRDPARKLLDRRGIGIRRGRGTGRGAIVGPRRAMPTTARAAAPDRPARAARVIATSCARATTSATCPGMRSS